MFKGADGRLSLDYKSAIDYYSADGFVIGMVAIEIFKYRAELKCPSCSSGNIDAKYRHMGEYYCRHCGFFWRTG